MKSIKKFVFFILIKYFSKKNNTISFENLNFKQLDFTNYTHIKTFIFKKNFYTLNNKYIQNFDFLNFSKNLGGKEGINLSRKNIFKWYKLNKNKISSLWSDDLSSRRLINLIYNYEFINSASSEKDKKLLDKIIYIHIQIVVYDFNNKKIDEITSYDLIGFVIALFLLKKLNVKTIRFIELVIYNQIDNLGMHKSYNVLEHAKFINNLNEIKNIFLFFGYKIPEQIETAIIKMSSILNEYFHYDGSLPLFNGTNNNYIDIIYNLLNKDEYLKSRNFVNSNNGLAFYSDKNKKIFFDVVQPNRDTFSKALSAGTLSLEVSIQGEKIISNCGASESFGKNPGYLRYSAAHSTIILQNTNISEIRENNPHINYPQSVSFNRGVGIESTIFEGSHNGYLKKFNKIIKRKIEIMHNENKIYGEDIIISKNNSLKKIIYHIRFHLVSGVTFNFTNNKRNIILKSKLNNMWLFKSDTELIVEDSIIVDKNITSSSKQIVIKGILSQSKQIKRWSLEKI